MYKRYNQEIKNKAKDLYFAGASTREIAKEIGITHQTVSIWIRRYGWKEDYKKFTRTKTGIMRQLEALSKGEITEGKAKRIAMLSRALSRLESVEKKNFKEHTKKPEIKIKYQGDLIEKFKDYDKKKLRGYQRQFIEDDSRFRCMLKARQIGMSWTIAYDMLRNGILREVDQNLVSTSLYQTENTIRYCRQHMKELKIAELGHGSKQEIILPNGKFIRTLPANAFTSQGWPGDVYYDEFAWYRHAKKVWEAITPTVTAVKGRVTINSTPYEAGPHNYFWVVATNDNNEFPNFSRHEVDIEDAVKGGLDIDLEELKSLFDTDTWARLYLCKYFTDDDSFFTLEELNRCRGDCLGRWAKVGSDRRAGWDMAKNIDASEVVAVEKLESQVFIRGVETWRRVKYVEQKELLVAALNKWGIREINIDSTGVGVAVREIVEPVIPANIYQNWFTFTQDFKARIAQNLKKLVEEERLVIPYDDRVLVSQFLNIKRQATKTGVSYDITRNTSGHGDRFWALALACNGIAFGASEIDIEIW